LSSLLNAYFVSSGWFVVVLPCFIICVIYHAFNIDLVGPLAFVGLSANFRDDARRCEWVRSKVLRCEMLVWCIDYVDVLLPFWHYPVQKF
jgi:hypothetical protein